MRVRPFRIGDEGAVLRLVDRAAATTPGGEALSEHKAHRMGIEADDVRQIVLDIGDPAGYAIATFHGSSDAGAGHWGVEIVVRSDVNDAGLDLLLGAMLAELPRGHPVGVWALDDRTAAAAVRRELEESRSLYRMERPLPVRPVPPPPDGTSIRTFRPGIDDEVWLQANGAAFAGHPENGSLTRADLHERTEQDWFDPAGFLLAWREHRVLGFCWTKLHTTDLGEIYIIGVVPEAQGLGLGTVLALHGLEDLYARQGARVAMLYVEGDNVPALRFYDRLGFSPAAVRRQFTGTAGATDA